MPSESKPRQSIKCLTPECKKEKRNAWYVRDQYSKPHKTTYEVYYCSNCRQEHVVKPKTRKYS